MIPATMDLSPFCFQDTHFYCIAQHSRVATLVTSGYTWSLCYLNIQHTVLMWLAPILHGQEILNRLESFPKDQLSLSYSDCYQCW
jgi:hypothetical protein